MKHVAAPFGDEGVTFKTRIGIPFNFPGVYRPSTDGITLVVDHVPTPFALQAPAGPVGSGCDPRDGWSTGGNGTRYQYRN